MKIILTGAQGQVGQAIQDYATAKGISLIALSRQELNIADESQVLSTFSQYQPDVVINAAAFTAVDLAEEQQEQAMLINARGPEILAKACAQYQALLIHFSTDYVFDGTSPSAYIETDKDNPINVYGATKLAGEKAIQQFAKRFIILRVSWVFGVAGQNFVKTILRLLSEKEELGIVDDQHGCPTSARSIATIVFKLIKTGVNEADSGIYHYCNRDATTWFGFAAAILDAVKDKSNIKTKKLLPITTAQMPRPAKRPMNSVLDCNKIKALFNIEPVFWQDELKNVLDVITK